MNINENIKNENNHKKINGIIYKTSIYHKLQSLVSYQNLDNYVFLYIIW